MAITLTDKAKEKIKEISDGESIGHYCIRIKLVANGCAGFSHDLMFDDQINQETDEVSDFDNNIKIVSDQLTYQYIQNITIDYLDALLEGGFKITSPDIKGTCGCEKSVSY